MKIGLSKLAEFQDETSAPMDKAQSQDTRVTCLSNCQYAQNPEKLCMLESISLQMMGQDGIFTCGQYSPVMDESEGMQAEKEIGLTKKSPKKKAKKKAKK